MRRKHRIRRKLARLGLPTLDISAGTVNAKEKQRRETIVDRLIANAQREALLALKAGDITLAELVEADRRGELGSATLLSGVVLARPLFGETGLIATLMPSLGKGALTRRRYGVSSRKLEASGLLKASATLRDLARLDWTEARASWSGSPADWMHLRRFVSRLLSAALGDKYHPERRKVMQAFPRESEGQGRVPDLTPELFYEVLTHAHEAVRPCFMALVLTGMRVGEYLRSTERDLLPRTHRVKVPGRKSEGSADTVAVAPGLWAWIEAAIPCRIAPRAKDNLEKGVAYDRRYKIMYRAWGGACEATGVHGITIHDLRHCHGQWAIDGGAEERKVQSSLRHADPKMTRRYTRTSDIRAVADALAGKLTPTPRAD